MLRDWRRQAQEARLPGLHGHQSKALADLSFARAIAEHCQGGRLAVAVPGDARPASVERRIERTSANERIDPASIWPQLARAVPGGWSGGPIVLVLDEAPDHNDSRCMEITLAYRAKAKEFHPDRLSGDDSKMIEINQAYATLRRIRGM